MMRGKIAVVTGSTSGIGLVVAAQGANVMINGFGSPDEIEEERLGIESELGIKALYSPADMSAPAAGVNMIAEAEREPGPVDILVNNAGVRHVAPIEEFPPEKRDAIIAIGLSSAFHAIRAAAPGMKRRKWGRVIDTASAHAPVASPF